MFDNIGDKIKTLAAIICWIGIIASICVGGRIISAVEDAILIGFIVMILGSLFSWVGSFITYGFGQLIENSDKLVKMQSGIDISVTEDTKTVVEKLDMLDKWKAEELITEEEYNQKKENLK